MQNVFGKSKFTVIRWSKTRNLKWSDFKKNSDVRSKNMAISAIGFKSEPLIDHGRIGKKFTFRIVDMQLQAVFIPSSSWISKNLQGANHKSLLRHEQGHFDLVEEIVRKAIIKSNNLFRGKFFEVEGKDDYSARKNSILKVNTLRTKIENDLKEQLKLEEELYDVKTNHGLIKLQQGKYDIRFNKLR